MEIESIKFDYAASVLTVTYIGGTQETYSSNEIDQYLLDNPGRTSADFDAMSSSPPSLSEVIAAKNDAADALRTQKATEQFTHGGREFDATTRSQGSISSAVVYGELNAIADATSRTWILANNTTVTLTWGELRAMATALFERNDALYGCCRTHKNNITALATVAAVNSYNITVNW